MYKYAQIDLETGFVQGVSYLSGEVDYPHMISLAEYPDDFNPLGWTYIDGEFIPPAEPESE